MRLKETFNAISNEFREEFFGKERIEKELDEFDLAVSRLWQTEAKKLLLPYSR